MGSAPPNESTYEELADLERDFDDIEADILRYGVKLKLPLYEKRQAAVSRIPNFWPLVFEQAPPEIDEAIQPTDSALLLSSLVSLSVHHFEIDDGHPRSVAIRFEFADNAYFEDRVLEKRFWYRRTRDGFAGLVSEPVDIRWRKGKDLTSGMLALARRVWEQEQEAENKKDGGGDESKKLNRALEESRSALRKKIDDTGLGGMSFFAWFGFCGRKVTEEENRLAVERENKRRAGEELEPLPEGMEEEDDDEEEEEEWPLEIFPHGDEIAVCISDELWPEAIKYFTMAYEQDEQSDDDFEESDEDEGDEENAREKAVDGEEARPSKKRKA